MFRVQSQFQKINTHLFAYATVLVAFFLRVYRLADKNVWWDEGWSLWLARQDFIAIALRTASDEHPPLHYWMLRIWDSLAGWDAFTARFLSVAFGVLTVALIYRIGKRVGGAGIGVLAALFIATARFHVWWSQDIKNYTSSIFFAFAAVWFAQSIITGAQALPDMSFAKPHSPTEEKLGSSQIVLLAMASWKDILGYALATTLALWTHYLTGLIIVAMNLYAAMLFLRRSSFTVRPWLIANTLAAILFAPWLIHYLQNAQPWSAAPAFDFGLFLRLVVTALPLGVTTNIEDYTGLMVAFTTIAVLGCLPVFSKKTSVNNNPGLRADHLILFALIILFPPILIYLLSLTPVSFFAPKIQARYLLVLYPAYAMLLALGVALLNKFSIYLSLAATIFILAASALVLRDYYAERRLHDEYATLANTINAFARQGDLVMLDTDQEWPVFLYYLRAPLEWVGTSNGKTMTDSDADLIARRALNRNGAIWLVAIPDALATDPQRILEARLSRDWQKQYEKTFDDKRLVLYSPVSRDLVSVASENFSPQVRRVENTGATAQLLGYDLATREVNSGDTLRVVTYWNSTNDMQIGMTLGNVSASEGLTKGKRVRVETDLLLSPNVAGEFPLQVNEIELTRVRIEPRATIASQVNIAHSVEYALGETIHLIGYDLPQTKLHAGDSVPITLYWRTNQFTAKNYSVFVHLLGPDINQSQNNFLWGQIDRAPREGTYPTTAWRLTETIPDLYRVPIAPNAPAAKYKIEVGMYDSATGVRLKLNDGSDSIILAEIEVIR